MANQKETLLDWLRDAHAMEHSLVSLLDKQVDLLKDKPALQGKVREHRDITKEQKTRLEGLIKKLGGDTSTVKDLTGKLFLNLQGIGASSAPDAIVKNALQSFALENFEIACYRSLIAAAESIGENDVKRVCQQILDEERDMAGWYEAQIPRVTQEYLAKQSVTH